MREFEERLKAVLKEVKNQKVELFFIDEIHMLVGAGKTDGAMDANMLKPMLHVVNCIVLEQLHLMSIENILRKIPL